MSNIYFISDLHLGHKRILEFEPNLRFGNTVDEHDTILIERMKSVCNNKRDILYICGDVAMDKDKLQLLHEIPARKILVRGNHDVYSDDAYRLVFDAIVGFFCYKGHWVSHAPIHPHELRGRRNIHGHVHRNSVLNSTGVGYDPNYINVCVENCEGRPINFAEIRGNTFKGVISNAECV